MTTTEDPYVRVEREDLAVGMRFDYRLPDEPWDTVERTLTSLDPIAYRSGKVGHVTLKPGDDITSEHEFYVHRDDITLVPTRVPVEEARVGEPIALDVGLDGDEVGSRLIRATRTWLGVDNRGRVEFQERRSAGCTAGTYTHVWVMRPSSPEPSAETAPEAASSDEAAQVPTHNGEPIMSEETARHHSQEYFDGWNAGAAQYRRLSIEAHEQGVREGYAKAQEERGAEHAAGMRHHPRFTREKAVMLAIQAVGGTSEASHALIPLAKDIERYVNGSDEQPAQPEFPSVIENVQQAALPWPIGTTATDNVGDGFEYRDGNWWWTKRADGSERDESTPYGLSAVQLPANVTRLGADA